MVIHPTIEIHDVPAAVRLVSYCKTQGEKHIAVSHEQAANNALLGLVGHASVDCDIKLPVAGSHPDLQDIFDRILGCSEFLAEPGCDTLNRHVKRNGLTTATYKEIARCAPGTVVKALHRQGVEREAIVEAVGEKAFPDWQKALSYFYPGSRESLQKRTPAAEIRSQL